MNENLWRIWYFLKPFLIAVAGVLTSYGFGLLLFKSGTPSPEVLKWSLAQFVAEVTFIGGFVLFLAGVVLYFIGLGLKELWQHATNQARRRTIDFMYKEDEKNKTRSSSRPKSQIVDRKFMEEFGGLPHIRGAMNVVEFGHFIESYAPVVPVIPPVPVVEPVPPIKLRKVRTDPIGVK